MTGSTRVARRVGMNAASAATTSMATTAVATGGTPPPDRSSIAVAANRVPQNATGAPTTNPAATSVSPLRSIIRVTSPRVAPSAMRIPISFVRRATV